MTNAHHRAIIATLAFVALAGRAVEAGKPLDMPVTNTLRIEASRVPREGHNLGATGELTVVLKGLRNDKGLARLALFGSQTGWPGEWSASGVAYGATRIEKGVARMVFTGVPHGSYAIIAYHDENNNGVTDSNFLGVPSEGYGFSNNVKPLISSPKFKEARFEIGPKPGAIEIRMIY